MTSIFQIRLGMFCKELREHYRISVLKIARNAECSPQAIYRFEKGTTSSINILLEYMRIDASLVCFFLTRELNYANEYSNNSYHYSLEGVREDYEITVKIKD